MFENWFSNKENTQTFDEAEANIALQKARNIERLQRRRDAGLITEKAYQDTVRSYDVTVEDPNAAAWDEFETAIGDEVKSIPGAVQNAASGVTGYFANTLARTVGSGVKNIFSGFFGASGITGVVVVIGLGLLLWWLFTKGPLSEAKVKVIPV